MKSIALRALNPRNVFQSFKPLVTPLPLRGAASAEGAHPQDGRLPSHFFFHTFSNPLNQQMPPRPKPPPESEIEESYLKGSGPGGQKINKTNSAVQLKHIPTGTVVKSQATRSRSQNRKIARQLLAEKLDSLANGEQSRSAIVGEVKRKKAASAAKKSRRKYKKLEEGVDKLKSTNTTKPGQEAGVPGEANNKGQIDTPGQ